MIDIAYRNCRTDPQLFMELSNSRNEAQSGQGRMHRMAEVKSGLSIAQGRMHTFAKGRPHIWTKSANDP